MNLSGEDRDVGQGLALLVPDGARDPRRLGEGELQGRLFTLGRAELALRQSEEKYRALMENASDPILITDTQGRLLEVNRRAEELFGYTRDELLARGVFGLHPESERTKILTAFRSLMQEGRFVCTDTVDLRQDGKSVPST